MDSKEHGPAMSQKIFNMGFSVETVSLYLLCCGLVDENTPVSLKKLANVWTLDSQALNQSLEDLENRNIIMKVVWDHNGNAAYKLIDLEKWK
jgi:hypothetical protein